MSKADHPIEQEELMAYLDGELSSERAAAAAMHLEQCADCQDFASALQGVSRRLAAWEVGPSQGVMPVVTASLDEHLGKPACSASFFRNSSPGVSDARWWAPWAGAVAAVCLLIVLGVRLIGTNANNVFSSVGSAVGDDDRGVQNSRAQNRDRLGSQARTRARLPSPEESTAVSGPLIVRTAGLKLITRDFNSLRSALEVILERHRGYVGEMNVDTPAGGGGRVLSATLRIPADQLDAVMAEVRKLGRAESETQGGQEITAQYVDLQARLENARNTESRLTEVLRQRTGKLADVLAVETEIARVRGEIESMKAERKNMANQVAFATLTLTATEDYNATLQIVPLSASTRFRNAAVEGYKTVTDSVVSLIVFLFSYGPSLLLWFALLFFPARSVWKVFRRRFAQ